MDPANVQGPIPSRIVVSAQGLLANDLSRVVADHLGLKDVTGVSPRSNALVHAVGQRGIDIQFGSQRNVIFQSEHPNREHSG